MKFIEKTFAVVCAVLAMISPALAASASQPNIVFIFSDDHAWQTISAYGSKTDSDAEEIEKELKQELARLRSELKVPAEGPPETYTPRMQKRPATKAE